jgi:glycosyltransferase involved in cell wall biosynthesis
MSLAKVLFLNHTGIVSGAERVLLITLDGFADQSIKPIVSCPEDSDLARILRERQIQIAGLPELRARFTWNPVQLIRYVRSYFRCVQTFREILRAQEPDLVHANSVRAGLLASFSAIGTGIPVIWHVHDIMKVHPFSCAIRWVAVTLPAVSILAVSHAAAKRFRGLLLRFPGKHVSVTVLHNPVNAQQFRPDAGERECTRQTLGLVEGQFVFAMIGQLTPRKGQLEAVRAFRDVVKHVPEARLLLVGAPIFNNDHRYLKLLKSEVEKLGLADSVLFLGHRRDVRAMLGAADAVVINSKREPFALIALEALAAAKPVVAASVDGIPELIEHEMTGFLFPAGDLSALSSAMLRLTAEPETCRRLSEQGRALVETHFTCDQYIQAVKLLYSVTLGHSRIVVASQPSNAEG